MKTGALWGCPCRAGDIGSLLSSSTKSHPGLHLTFSFRLWSETSWRKHPRSIPWQQEGAKKNQQRSATRSSCLAAGAGWGGADSAHLHWPHLHLRGPALHVAVIAAAGAALHLHAGWPHQEVGVGAIDEVPRDLEHLCACLALGDYGRLCCCQGPWREEACQEQTDFFGTSPIHRQA